jgi:hypothetical protein
MVPVPIPPQKFTPISFDAQFDDYWGGPTIEDMTTYPKYLDNFPTNPYAVPVTRSRWEYFKDYGYRIQPDFSLMFNCQNPILVAEHILPIGRIEPTIIPEPAPERWRSLYLEELLREVASTDRMGKKRERVVRDVKYLGIKGILDAAGSRGGQDSVNAFVCGKTPDNKYVRLDLARDAIRLSPEEVHITLDIDSIIWVTHQLEVRTSVKVHVLPYLKRLPPIHKNNHCHVEILWPRSDSDREAGSQRNEWFTKPVPLSHIPHVPFAQLGDGSGSFNFYVAFPRMMHRNTFNGHWETLIPSEVQSLWITEVLIPAIRNISVPGVVEYADFTLAEWTWKATVNNQLHPSKSLVLDPRSFLMLQKEMREIIKDHPHQLDMFGSLFFVMDARGIKLNTMSIRDRNQDPYVTLQQEFPGIPWEGMMLRENGQLLMDLGISYHPVPRDKRPLIGLWKLESIEASHAATGMTKPEIFRCCTMANYGGVQSTMGSARSRSVQIISRSTYNLLFEAFRRPGQEEKFCTDGEAYDLSPAFKQTCKEFYDIYQGAKTKSYGVRDELRGSGMAIKEAVRYSIQKVNEFQYIFSSLTHRLPYLKHDGI